MNTTLFANCTLASTSSVFSVHLEPYSHEFELVTTLPSKCELDSIHSIFTSARTWDKSASVRINQCYASKTDSTLTRTPSVHCIPSHTPICLEHSQPNAFTILSYAINISVLFQRTKHTPSVAFHTVVRQNSRHNYCDLHLHSVV